MHISFVLETFRCRTLLLHQLEKRTTEERYDWYEAKSLKRASMAVSSENLTTLVVKHNSRHVIKTICRTHMQLVVYFVQICFFCVRRNVKERCQCDIDTG